MDSGDLRSPPEYNDITDVILVFAVHIREAGGSIPSAPTFSSPWSDRRGWNSNLVRYHTGLNRWEWVDTGQFPEPVAGINYIEL